MDTSIQPQQEEVKQEEVKLEDVPVEVQAARYLITALPRFRGQLEKVTGTQAKRVLQALIESPLEKNTLPFTTPEALELFNQGLVITNAKFILFQASLKDDSITKNLEQQAQEAGSNGDVGESTSDNNGGEANGS